MGTDFGGVNIDIETSSTILPTNNLNNGIYIVNLVVNGQVVDGEQLLVVQ